jgi:drug/metabolite transporter (DMT)-like permease
MNPASQAPDDAHAIARGRALMLFSVACFVANSLLVRVLGTSFAVDTWLITIVRFVAGFLFVAVLAYTGYPGGRISFSALVRNPWLVARGVIGGASVFIYYLAINEGEIGRVTFITATYIPLGAVFAWILLREPLHTRLLVAMVLGFAGIALLTGLTFAGWSLAPGDLLALLTAVCSGVAVVLIRKLHQTETTSSIFVAQCVWGFAFAVGPAAHSWAMPTSGAIALLVLAAATAASGQLAVTSGFRLLPVAEGSLFQMLLPVGIAVGGVLFFDEQYTVSELAGSVLIFGSCLVAAKERPRLAFGLPAWLQRNRQSDEK